MWFYIVIIVFIITVIFYTVYNTGDSGDEIIFVEEEIPVIPVIPPVTETNFSGEFSGTLMYESSGTIYIPTDWSFGFTYVYNYTPTILTPPNFSNGPVSVSLETLIEDGGFNSLLLQAGDYRLSLDIYTSQNFSIVNNNIFYTSPSPSGAYTVVLFQTDEYVTTPSPKYIHTCDLSITSPVYLALYSVIYNVFVYISSINLKITQV
jgi:hypothetical protein